MDVRFTVQDDVVFCESKLEGREIGSITEKAAKQNTTLTEVKRLMAQRAKSLGGDAVINFAYTQKADRGRNLLKWDTERIVCTGIVVQLDNPESFRN